MKLPQDISTLVIFPAGIESNISFGRYLAKDDGFTFDLGRKTKSDLRLGYILLELIYQLRDLVRSSFDKGFYFQIPFDLFSNEYSGDDIAFRLSPLTRDGGAKLTYDKDLQGMIYNSTLYEISRQWGGFLK